MAYENYESVLIKGFGDDILSERVIMDNTDITDSKPRKYYQQYLSKLTQFKSKEFKIEQFPKLGSDKVIDLASSIIVAIYGKKIMPILMDYYNNIYQSETRDPLDGISISAINTITKEKTEIVEVPNFDYSSTITAIVHEFTHYLLRRLNIGFERKRYYEEIISIYAEKISNLYVSKELGLDGNRFIRQIEECRIEGINWHYNTNLPAMEMMLREYNRLKHQRNSNIFISCKLTEIENSLPILKNAKGESILRGYYKNLADSYGIGYLFAESLYQRHLDDFHIMGEQIRKLLDHEQSLQELLNYYGINTRETKVYNAVEHRLSELKKIR